MAFICIMKLGGVNNVQPCASAYWPSFAASASTSHEEKLHRLGASSRPRTADAVYRALDVGKCRVLRVSARIKAVYFLRHAMHVTQKASRNGGMKEEMSAVAKAGLLNAGNSSVAPSLASGNVGEEYL